MRAKLLGAVLAALIIPTAMAADVGKQGKIISASPPAAAEDIKWNRTGAYVGLLAGYDVSILKTEGIDFANGKLMAGGFVGYNYRLAGFIVGIEGDWIFTNISASSSSEELSLKASTDHLISIRVRAGIPLGPALLYVTAGPAWQHAKLTVNETTAREWHLGAAMGGGIEVELTRSLFVRAEALHYIFPANGAPLASFFESENQHTTVRLGLGFKLN